LGFLLSVPIPRVGSFQLIINAEESRQLFGVNLAGQDIQPVWIRVQNADTIIG
jgi:hypothetical protein